MNAEEQKIYNEMLRLSMQTGKPIEAGFKVLRCVVIPLNAPAAQIDAMRMAYMSGAQHLMSIVMGILDPGREATEADITNMGIISAEMDAFAEEFKLRTARTGRPQ